MQVGSGIRRLLMSTEERRVEPSRSRQFSDDISISWHVVAIAACIILLGVFSFLAAKGYERLEGKLDRVVYEKDQYESRCREAMFDAKLNVIYNAHVPEAMRLPVNIDAIKRGVMK
jgi:hypothetical protein